MVLRGLPMSDSSNDSADTVISVRDSRLLSQSLSESEPDSQPLDSSDSEQRSESVDMGNRQGAEKKKKKDDTPQERKTEDKPKKKGKKSKGKSKRNSQNVEIDVAEGACASPSGSTSTGRSRSKRPDVLADLGKHAPGSPLGSPESACGSQGTWSPDDESDVSTLGYSTPLLSTPQVQRYVLPKQTSPQQSSNERLEELGRSIERTIIDKLSDRAAGEAAEAASATGSGVSAPRPERKERRNVKKKRALGQAVIDSDSFSLPLHEVKSGQTSSPSPTSKRLNVGTDKISLRASQESPVSPWLRDDDTPVDEEQMDEMFISCIDLSYNLADICSEKEFTEYGSLDSKKQSKSAKERTKETSLSPRIARKPIIPMTPPLVPIVPEVKTAGSRETPPKSDSSTSTLHEVGCDPVVDIVDQDLRAPTLADVGRCPVAETVDSDFDLQTVGQDLSKDSPQPVKLDPVQQGYKAELDPSNRKPEDTTDCSHTAKSSDIQFHAKSKQGKSKSKSKSKKKNSKDSCANKETFVPTEIETVEFKAENPEQSAVCVKSDTTVCDRTRLGESTEPVSDYENEPAVERSQEKQAINVDKAITKSDLTSGNGSISTTNETCVEKSDIQNEREIQEEGNNEVRIETDTTRDNCDKDKPVEMVNATPIQEEANVCHSSKSPENTLEPASTEDTSANLSPTEPASFKHVPPPSPSAMDALAEVDEEDEDALEAMEENSQLKEVQLFGETVFKRLSSLVESQSQDEDMEDRFKDFSDNVELDTDSPPVNLGSMALLSDPVENGMCKGEDGKSVEPVCPKEVVEEPVVPGSVVNVEKGVVIESGGNTLQLSTKEELILCGLVEDKEDDDDGTLKRKKKKSNSKKNKKEKSKKDPQGHVVKRPEIPEELKQAERTDGTVVPNSGDLAGLRLDDESEKENTPPKRESQQIEEVIDAYGIADLNIEKPSTERLIFEDDRRPRYESDGSESDDSDSSFNSKSRSSELPSSSSVELTSRGIPEIEETFSELLSVKHILEDLEDRTPTEEILPSFVGYDELRSPPEFVNGRRSRMSPAVTDRTESDLDISEQRDDISTDSMYADDEDDGASEVLFSRSYSEPAGNEVVVSCTFYNTQHNSNNNNMDDSDDFWDDYSTADESFKQIEISADAASSTFQNARKQMHDIHQHLQDLRRQMEHLQEEVESATLTPEYSMDSEDKRQITE